MTNDLIETLLHGSEGSSLDFKRDQYPFVNADDDKKAELLKDILAFSNAWRRDDAYILIGIKATQGGRAEVVGVEDHFDDAQLQQFVNEKTNRKITFSYEVALVDGKKVGVLRIPRQPRPTYLMKDYGAERGGKEKKLRANAVYIRQGSSTTIATPEDIGRIYLADAEEKRAIPFFDIQFVDPRKKHPLGAEVRSTTVSLKYREEDIPLLKNSGYVSVMDRVDEEHLRKLASFSKFHHLYVPVSFRLENLSTTVAQDVHVQFSVRNPNIVLASEGGVPPFPERQQINNMAMIGPRGGSRIRVRTEGDSKVLVAQFGKLQAKRAIVLDEFFVIGNLVGQERLELDVLIFADETQEPQHVSMSVEINTTEVEPDVKSLLDLLRKMAEIDDGDEVDWFRSSLEAIEGERKDGSPVNG